MKVVFKNVSENTAQKMLMAERMSSFIWHLVNNGWRTLDYSGYDYGPAWERIGELLDAYDIDINVINKLEQNTDK
jgi:hypothetical protein